MLFEIVNRSQSAY